MTSILIFIHDAVSQPNQKLTFPFNEPYQVVGLIYLFNSMVGVRGFHTRLSILRKALGRDLHCRFQNPALCWGLLVNMEPIDLQ